MKNKVLIAIFLFISTLLSSPAFCDDVEDAAVYYNEAIDLYKENQVEKSIELFTKSTELNPNFYEAYYNLSQIYMSLNKNELAISNLEHIIKLRPDDTEALYNLGKLQYKKGYLQKSHHYLTMIEESAPQYDSAKILIDKIEKRQDELNLEAKIKETQKQFDPQGKAKGVDLIEIQAPSGCAVDSRGNIYAASFSENTIYKISSFGKKTVLSKSSLIKGPIGIAIDKDDNIYTANYSSNNIIKITPQNAVSVYAAIEKPYSLFYDEEHNRLYATEQSTNKLVKFDL